MIRYGRKKIRYNHQDYHIKGCKNWWETDGVYGTKKSERRETKDKIAFEIGEMLNDKSE